MSTLSESYCVNTNKPWFRRFSKTYASLCFGRVNTLMLTVAKSIGPAHSFDKISQAKAKFDNIFRTEVNLDIISNSLSNIL